MRYQGKITSWNDDKGYGFVEPNGGGKRAFVHIKSFSKSARRPVNGDTITYSLVHEKDGRVKADKVRFSEKRKNKKKPKSKDRKLGKLIVAGFCAFLLITTISGKLPFQLLVYYAIASMITFAAYAQDKSAAQRGKWRIKETTLHILATVGGWPGAFFAQTILRHKTIKAEFLLIYWATVVVNLGITSYFFTERGGKLIRSIVGV